MNIEAGERVEGDLDRYITNADKRRRKVEGERPAEASYMPNVRAAGEVRHQQNLWDQLRWHAAQARRHKTVSALIIRHHEQEVARLERVLGINYDDGDAA